MKMLAGKVAIVTGNTRIGLATAQAMANAGASVVIPFLKSN